MLLSDGAANAGVNVGHGRAPGRRRRRSRSTPSRWARRTATLPNPDPLGPPVPVPPDPQLMAQIAKLSGGRTFNAQSADELSSIYKRLGNQLGSVTRKREVTAAFAVGGLVLLLLAAAGSARWSGRLP